MAKEVKKTAVKKTTPKKTVKKEVLPAVVAVKPRKSGDLSVEVFSPEGKVKENMELPKEYFAAKVNPALVAQAVRVYLANQREGGASTKTRGEVQGSTRKIFRQKGTGRARHGGIRAPIFVGGGIAFGPRTHSFSLTLPQKMRKQALASALTTQLQKGAVKVVGDVTNLPMKTSAFASMFETLSCTGKTLFFLAGAEQKMLPAIRNLDQVDILPVKDAHTYAVLVHRHIVFTKDAVTELGSIAK